MEAPQSEVESHSTNSPFVQLKDDFYRDGFRVVMLSFAMVVATIALLIIISLYFFFHQVLPINFPVYQDWRVQAEVPVNQPYLRVADLLQWVSQAVPALLTIDFINYDQELKKVAPYFTSNGWAKFMALTNTYLNHDDILKNKIFVQAQPSGAPVILNQGAVDGKYAWWVQIPIDVRYSGIEGNNRMTTFLIQVLVIRESTLDNLDGVVIDNLIAKQG